MVCEFFKVILPSVDPGIFDCLDQTNGSTTRSCNSSLTVSREEYRSPSVTVPVVCIHLLCSGEMDPVSSSISERVKMILMTFETGSFVPELRMLSKKCKFNTVKRLLLSLNTTWDRIVLTNGSHWMLTELHLTTDDVHIYDWTMDREEHDYDKITGLISFFRCLCF